MSSAVIQVNSPDHFRSLLSEDLQRVSLINFWAPWAAPCEKMNELVAELAIKYPELLTLQVAAEEQPDVAESFEIEAVPTFIILQGHTLLSRINGADAAALTTQIATFIKPKVSVKPLSSTNRSPATASRVETQEELNTRLKALVNQDKIMLFMKGTPSQPRCGFSRRIVELLNAEGVKYSTFDIFSDEGVRAGLKEYNNWPTFPQLIINGEFVGGLDIVLEMVENGEFRELVQSDV